MLNPMKRDQMKNLNGELLNNTLANFTSEAEEQERLYLEEFLENPASKDNSKETGLTVINVKPGEQMKTKFIKCNRNN